jgi:hypothetical protein
MVDFFISYNSTDGTWAEWIAWQLEDAGYTTVLQAWDFRPGSNFVLEMERAAGEAERTIVVLSPAYVSARYTQPEWATAFARDPTSERGLLLPVRVERCALQGLLPQIVYIDLVGLDEDAAKKRLLDGVQRDRAKPTSPPSYPGSAPQPVAEQPRFPGELPSVQSASDAPWVPQVPWAVVRLSRANATEYRLEDGRHSHILGSINENYERWELERVIDLDRDRVQDAIVMHFTGGAHCCFEYLIASRRSGKIAVSDWFSLGTPLLKI